MATGWPSTDPLNLCRAIIAYVTAQGAEEAERANIPNVRIRRRKPRQSEKRREDSPKHSKTNTSHSLHEDGTDVLTLNGIPPTLPESKLMEPIPRRSSGQRHDDNIVVEDIEDEEDRHDEISPQQLHPASFLREDIYTPHTDTNDSQATVDDEIIDSAAASTSESTQLNECSAPKPSEVDPVQDNLTELSPDMVKATNPEKSSASQNDSDAEAQQTEEATQVSIELTAKYPLFKAKTTRQRPKVWQFLRHFQTSVSLTITSRLAQQSWRMQMTKLRTWRVRLQLQPR